MVYYEISIEDIRNNIKAVMKTAGVPLWGVLKYDGYGIGTLNMAEILRAEGVTRFAVSDTNSLISLRKGGFASEEILLLSPQPTDEEISAVLDNRGIFSVGTLEYAGRIDAAAKIKGITASAHAAVDTGMGRFGFFSDNYADIKQLYTEYKNIKVSGVFSHLSSAFAEKTDRAYAQFAAFSKVLDNLANDGIDRGMAHLANSSGLFKFPEMRLDAVRSGSALVGRVSGVNAKEKGLLRVGCLIATVAEIKEYPKGYNIGYGNGFKVKKPFTGAVLSAGEWAGLPVRRLTQKLRGRYNTAEVNGKTVPIVASAGEGHSVIDVTGLDVSAGDIVRIDINPLSLNSTVEKHYI